jgi:hypothetical protein
MGAFSMAGFVSIDASTYKQRIRKKALFIEEVREMQGLFSAERVINKKGNTKGF